MIKSVTITNYRSEKKTIVLSDPWSTGVAITSISGLGPVKATINMTEIAAMDGARYNSSRIPARNIVLTFALDYFPTIEHARNELYRLFSLKHTVTLEFRTDIRLYRTTGYVESVEPNIFSSQELVTVSVLCPSPFFEAVDEANDFYGELDFEHSFEFEFSNESVSAPVIEFGNESSSIDFTVDYKGYSSTGLTFHIKIEKEAPQYSTLTISKNETGQSIQIDLTNVPDGVQVDDEFVVCTVPGKKSVSLKRGNQTYNILNAATIMSGWMIVEPGSNIFNIAVSNIALSCIKLWFDYIPLYEGL